MPEDPLHDRLAALGTGPTAPLAPVAAVRARGEQRRRRGQALLGGTGALLTALAVLAGTTLASSEPPREADVLDVATPTPTPVEDPVRAALLDPEDVDRVLGGSWAARPDAGGTLPASVLPTACEDGSAFAISAPQQGDQGTALRELDGPDGVVGHVVLRFGSPAGAEAAESRLFRALRSCSPAGSFLGDTPGRNVVPGDRPLVVLREGAVLTAVRGAAPDDEALRALGDAALAELAASGLVGPSPAPPRPVPSPSASDDPSPQPVDTTVDPALLLDDAAVEEVLDGDWTGAAPVEDPFLLVSPCGGTPGAPGGLRRSLDGPDGGSLLSQVLRYGDEAGARAALDQLFEELQRCPTSELDSDDGNVEHTLLAGEDDTLLEIRRRTVPKGADPYTDGATVQQVGSVLVLVLTNRVDDLPALAEAAGARVTGDSGGPADVRAALLDPEDTAAVEEGDWQEQEVVEARLLDPCEGGTAYPQDEAVREQVARSLAVRREAGGTSIGQEVWRYRTAADAREAVAGYARAVQGCPREPGRGEGVTTVHEVVERSEVDLVVRVTGECASCVPYPSYLAAVVDDDVVLVLAVSVGEDGDPGVPFVRRYLDAAVAELERSRG